MDKIKKVKQELANLNVTADQRKRGNKNSDFVGKPIQYLNIDPRLRENLTREEYMSAFSQRLIGNNGHKGSIIANAADIDQ